MYAYMTCTRPPVHTRRPNSWPPADLASAGRPPGPLSELPQPVQMGLVIRDFLDTAHVVSCAACRTHLTHPDDLISKEFRGASGPANLYGSTYAFWLFPGPA